MHVQKTEKRTKIRTQSYITSSARSSAFCSRSYRQRGTDIITCLTYTQTPDRRGVCETSEHETSWQVKKKKTIIINTIYSMDEHRNEQ